MRKVEKNMEWVSLKNSVCLFLYERTVGCIGSLGL